ncbi:MAG TPA: rhodanese-like domain-containing protein, partial [Flavobacteriales bacterium]|nr:rhodanese-like domain-containing protein [Flavobacteriales bacterium]
SEGKEHEAVLRLARVGYDNTVGHLKGGIDTWKAAGRALDHVENITAEGLAQLNPPHIVDVRKPGEFEAGHVAQAVSYPLDFINDHLNDLHKGHNHYVHCKSGYRSVIAISILKKQGYTGLVDVLGGYSSMEKTNIPLVDVCTKGA